MKKIPLFMMLFISMFGFIGLTLLIALWTGMGDFGSPPLFFKVFASFIALAFMIMGFGVPLAALSHRTSDDSGTNLTSVANPDAQPPVGYKCPHCGAGIEKQEVSPSGDVKCGYCQKWYNIHRPAG
jgi:hypothetical protein